MKWIPGLPAERLHEITDGLVKYPEDFHIHPKVQKLLEQRQEMGYGKRPLDFGMAEALAFGSLALQSVPIRLSGQDSRRGTFNQRHSVLIDIVDEKEYVPLCHLAPNQARVEIYNSELSEAAVMGFEYGYTRDYPETLVMWEAQFGDFANGAQIIIDQFVAAGEDKWDLLTGLVLSAAARPRRTRAGALQRAHRALSAIVRARQHAGVPALHCGAILPSAAPTGAAQVAQTARSASRPRACCAIPRRCRRFPDLERPRFMNIIPDDTALDASACCFAPARSAMNYAWSAGN